MREAPLRLGVLDFSWVMPGRTPAQALRDTFAVAKRAEALGYARYWLGEHHLEGHATGSPHVLAGILAASTRKIRVGIGALLLYYWSPLRIAEDFRLLEAIFGRIDLGVGRGRADSAKAHLALLEGRGDASDKMLDDETYQTKLDDLVGFLRGQIPAGHRYEGAPVLPELDVAPQIWVCGAESAATHAARIGASFCCTLFHGRLVDAAHLERYRRTFQPSKAGATSDTPTGAIAVCGVCTETEAEAIAIREAFPHRNYLPSVMGTPEQCKTRVDALREAYGVDEVIVLDMAPDAAKRVRSLELMAQVFELDRGVRRRDLREAATDEACPT